MAETDTVVARLLAFADAQDSGGCCDKQFDTGSELVREAAATIASLQAENEALRRERDEARANSVSRGKKLLRLRIKIEEISDNIEHEGDRAYFGSTNDADELRAAFLWLDAFRWDRVMSESDEDDLLLGIEKAVARAAVAEAAREAAEAEAARLREAKDGAYEERNKVVAALARLFPSGLARTDIPGWSPDWHGCVYIDLPTGQVSWHFHDSQAVLFAGLPAYSGAWDGHDTDEKYRRLAALGGEHD